MKLVIILLSILTIVITIVLFFLYIRKDNKNNFDNDVNNRWYSMYSMENLKNEKTGSKSFEKTLKDFRDDVKKENINFTLAGGTALEYYRENIFYGPVDIFIFRKDLKSEKQLLDSLSNNFKLIYKRGNIDNGLELSFENKTTNSKLNIFIMYETKNFYWIGLYEGKNYNYVVKFKYPKIEFQKIKILNEDYNIVSKEYLNTEYGDSWIKPENLSKFDILSNNFGFRWYENDKYENDCSVPVKSNTFVNDFFKDNVWFINLDYRKDRFDNTISQFDSIGIKAKRFPAINALSDSNVKNIMKDPITQISAGEVGCTLSHREIWKYAVNNKVPWTLIFEDDIHIEEGIDQTHFAEGMIESLCGKRNTQIVFFGLCFGSLKELKQNNKFFKVMVENVQHAYCCHAYAVTWRMAKELLDLTLTFEDAVDEFINYIPYDLRTFVYVKDHKSNYFGDGIVKQNRTQYKSSLRDDDDNLLIL